MGRDENTMSMTLKDRIEAARDQARATAATLDAVLLALGNGHAGAPGACEHPPESRIPAARMGRPDAWICHCGMEGGI